MRALKIRDYKKGDKIFQYETAKYFPNAGLFVYKKNNIYIVLGLKKGGIIKIFKDNKEIYLDCGYRVKAKKSGGILTTNWQDNSYNIIQDGTKFVIEGYMNKVNQKVSTPIMHMGLRIISLLFGNKIIGFLKKKLIFANTKSNIYFKRIIKIEGDKVSIQDHIKSPDKITLEKASNMSLRHVASGKFFMNSDLLYNKKIYEKENEFRIREVIEL